jgi:hypothetical protein
MHGFGPGPGGPGGFGGPGMGGPGMGGPRPRRASWLFGGGHPWGPPPPPPRRGCGCGCSGCLAPFLLLMGLIVMLLALVL